MALFKPFRGNSTDLSTRPLHDGYAYFCVDDGSFYIDYIDADGEVKRKQINESILESKADVGIIVDSEEKLPKNPDVGVINIVQKKTATNGVLKVGTAEQLLMLDREHGYLEFYQINFTPLDECVYVNDEYGSAERYVCLYDAETGEKIVELLVDTPEYLPSMFSLEDAFGVTSSTDNIAFYVGILDENNMIPEKIEIEVTKEYAVYWDGESWVKLVESNCNHDSIGEKAEIFNDYENNVAYGDYSHAEGEKNISYSRNSHAEGGQVKSGGRGFKIISCVNEGNGNGYYIVNTTELEGLVVGDRYSVRMASAKYDIGAITNIEVLTNETTKLTVNNYPNIALEAEDVTDSASYTVENYLTIVGKPHLGNVDVGFNTHVEGEKTIAQDRDAHAEGRGTKAIGQYAHAEGRDTTAAYAAHAEGRGTKAMGDISHTEGQNTTASAMRAHAEGYSTTASGNNSHAEGQGTKAIGEDSHAEGLSTTASGLGSHTEGELTQATAKDSHAEGYKSIASDFTAHAEGNFTQAMSLASHSEGANTRAARYASHAEGDATTAAGEASHAEGSGTYVHGDMAHAEGEKTTSFSRNSHAEGGQTKTGGKGFKITSCVGPNEDGSGYYTIIGTEIDDIEIGVDRYNVRLSTAAYDVGVILNAQIKENGVTELLVSNYPNIALEAEDVTNSENYTVENYLTIVGKPHIGNIDIGFNAHSEGEGSIAQDRDSHAEGRNTKAIGQYSHAEGRDTVAAYAAHAEGRGTKAMGNMAHAEGQNTTANGDWSHAEGRGTVANANWTHAEGQNTKAMGTSSHTEGQNTEATGVAAHAEGYNSQAIGISSHAEGHQTISEGTSSHTEGQNTHATNVAAHAEGSATKALGVGSHAEGQNTEAEADLSHTEGYLTKATGTAAHAEGSGAHAEGSASHAEGQDTMAQGYTAHVEGIGSNAIGEASHGEGFHTSALGQHSHTEGNNTKTFGTASHAEGYENIAGAKCFKLDATHEYSESDYNVDENTGKYYTVSNPEVITQELINAGLEYSLYLTGNYNLQGRVISVGENYIEVTNYCIPNSWEMNNLHSGSYIFFPMVPHLGDEPCGTGAHVEGYANFAVAVSSHAEGYNNKAVGKYSHAEGRDNIAGHCNHVEGINNKILSDFSHMEGSLNSAPGSSRYSHTEGYKKISFGQGSHAEGGSTNHVTGLRDGSATFDELFLWENAIDTEHVEKFKEIVLPRWRESWDFGAAGGAYSHAEGLDSLASDIASHAEGTKTIANANSSHSEGRFTQALGTYTHAEGFQNIAIGTAAHSEGGSASRMSDSLLTASTGTIENSWKTSKNFSVAAGSYSHNEGNNTATTGYAAHAEGQQTLASGVGAHSEGRVTIAAGLGSHAEGFNTIANGSYQHVGGKWNVADNSSLFIIGNGTSETNRKNALKLDSSENLTVGGKIIPGDYTNLDERYVKQDGDTGDILRYCGTVDDYSKLPENVDNGNVYNVEKLNVNNGLVYTGKINELFECTTEGEMEVYNTGNPDNIIFCNTEILLPEEYYIELDSGEKKCGLYDEKGDFVGELVMGDIETYPSNYDLEETFGVSDPNTVVTVIFGKREDVSQTDWPYGFPEKLSVNSIINTYCWMDKWVSIGNGVDSYELENRVAILESKIAELESLLNGGGE